MARLAESNNAHTWNAKLFRFRSAIRGGRSREQLRRIDCRRQRKVLVRPAKEEILKRWHFKARSGLAGLTRRSRISKASRGKAAVKALHKITKQRNRDFLTEGNEDNEGFLGTESLFSLLPSVKIFCL